MIKPEMSADGGYLIPRVTYIDKPSKGWLASFLRWLGQRVIYLGAWICSLGYYQVEIHPYEEIAKTFSEMSESITSKIRGERK